MIKAVLLALSLLLTSPTFAGGDDDPFEMRGNALNLRYLIPETRTPATYRLDEDFTAKIIRKIVEQRETLEEVYLGHYGKEGLQNLLPILQELEKCPKIHRIFLEEVTKTSLFAHVLLSLRNRGSAHCMGGTHAGIDRGEVARTCIERVAAHLGCDPLPKQTAANCLEYVALKENRDEAVHAFLKKCRDENIFLLSDPKYQHLFQPPFPQWGPS